MAGSVGGDLELDASRIPYGVAWYQMLVETLSPESA